MATVSPTSSDFPSFAELCRQAREHEKSLISVPPSPIAGTFGAEEAGPIFPKEFESYTFAYMLSEAYKIERNLFATRYQSAVSSGARQSASAGDPRITADLKEFVSRDVRGTPSSPAMPPKQGIAPPSPAAPQPAKAPEWQSSNPAQPTAQAKSSFPVFKVAQTASQTGQSAQPQDSGQGAAKPMWPSVTTLPSRKPQQVSTPPPSPPSDGEEGKPPYEVEEFEKGAKDEGMPAAQGKSPFSTGQKKSGAVSPPAIPSKKEQERANLIPEEEEDPLPTPEPDEAPLPDEDEAPLPDVSETPVPSPDEESPRQRQTGKPAQSGVEGASQGAKAQVPAPNESGEWVVPTGAAATMPSSVSGEKKPPVSSLATSSKISPRLRAIIEEKMRKDEESERLKKSVENAEDAERAKEPAQEQPEEQDGQVMMSSRERLLKKFEQSYPKKKMASEDFLESERELSEGEREAEDELGGKAAEEDAASPAGGPASSEASGDGAGSEEAAKEPDDDIYEDPAHPAPKKKAVQAPMEEDSRFAGWATEKKATPPSQAALDEKKGESAQEEPPATVVPAAQPFTIGKGGMLIQPIFAGEERKQPEGGAAASAGKEASEPAQEERIRKIQRIIDELSPDKYKAASLPQKEAAVAEKPSYKKPHSPSRSIEVNEEAPGANEGASGKEGPEKEETPAEEGQPQAPGKKKQQVPAAKKPAQAPVPEEDGMPALQEEKLAKAKPVSRAAVQKKVAAPREEELPAEDGGSSAQGEEPLQQDEPQEEIAHAKKAPGARSARVLPKKTAIAKAAAVKRKKPAAEDEDASAQLADTEDEEPPDEPAPSAAQSRVAAGKQAASKKQAAAKAQPAAMERTAKAQPAAIERTAKSQTDSKKQLASGQQSEEPPEEPAPSAAKSQVAAGKQAASKKQAAAKVQPATRKQPVMQPSAKLLPAEKKQAVRAAGKPAQEPAPDDEQPAVQAAAKQSSAPRKLPVAAKAQPEARMHAPAKATAAAKKQAPAREEKPDEPEQETSQFPRTLVQKPVPKQSSLQSAGARQPQVPPYAKDTSAVPTSSERQRILPGGVSVPSSTYAQTYVPPARPRTPPSLVREQQPSDSEPVSVKVPLGKPRMLPKKPVAIKEVEEKTPDELEQEKLSSMPLDSVRKKLAAEGQGAPSDSGQEQSDSGQDDGIPSPEGEEGKAPREGEKQKSALPARPFEQSSREISGEAALPENNEDDSLSVPAPPPDEKPPEPAPGDYSDAKEQLRRKIAEEGLKRGITAESEEMLEQYAKENLIWLYEIYKMGGMSREDFLDKVREQSHNGQPGGADGNQQEQPANPALENLNRELEKKMKK